MPKHTYQYLCAYVIWLAYQCIVLCFSASCYLSLHIGKDSVRRGRRELKLVPLSRKAHIWNLTGLLCDVCIAGTLYTAREVGEGRDFENHSVHVCVKVGSGSLCARASVSSVCVTLSQIVSHHECASVLLLSSPCFRVRKKESVLQGRGCYGMVERMGVMDRW